MRVTKEAKAYTNEKIIEEASRLFREKGIGATSVTDIMVAAGLTHGGFYRHFKSKNDLAVTAIRKMFDAVIIALEEDIAKNGAYQAVTDYIGRYLSMQHVANLGKGCPIVALGAEVGRGGELYADVMYEGEQKLISLLVLGMGDSEGRKKAAGLLVILVGTLVMARSVSDKTLIDEILSSGRKLAHGCLEK